MNTQSLRKSMVDAVTRMVDSHQAAQDHAAQLAAQREQDAQAQAAQRAAEAVANQPTSGQ